MALVSASTIQGERAGASTASPAIALSLRTDQHQMFGHSRAGQARGECCAQAPAAHKAQARRLGRGDVTPVLSHCRSAAGHSSPHSRRPVFETLPGIGLHFPAERIRAARGAFIQTHGFGANRPHAQSLEHQQTVNVSADVPHIQPRLSSKSSFRPDHHGRSEKGWRYQIPVMRCPT